MTAQCLPDLTDAGDAVAIVADDASISYRALSHRADTWADAFARAGIRPGDRIAAQVRASIEAIAAMIGALRCDAAWVPINPAYGPVELAHVLTDSGARLWLHDDPVARPLARVATVCVGLGPDAAARMQLAPPIEPTREDAAGSVIIYTSGTTGASKGVLLGPEAITRGIGALVDAWRFTASDRLSLALPIFHVHGLGIGVFGSLLRRATLRVHPRFDPARIVADFAASPPCTVFMGVPTMYVALLEHLRAHPAAADSLRRARLFTAGSAALAPAVLQELEARTGHRILERYGMTETLISLTNPYDGVRVAGHVGCPVPGYAIRIVDEALRDVASGEAGELLVRGPGLMRGYWNRPDATTAAFVDGWFRTGDLVRLDPERGVQILGRLSVDIIKSGGFKIAAGEIEQVVRTHPDIIDVAVLGVPDERWGERIVAAIVLRDDAPARDWPTAVAEHVAAHLAAYKKPRGVIVLDALPKNALGKVLKTELRASFLGERDLVAPRGE